MTTRFSSLACAACLLVSSAATAAPVLVDFDAINASAGPVGGAPLDSYLAGFGITLSNIVGPAGPSVYDTTTTVFGITNYFGPPSMPNFIWQPTTNGPIGYKMNFAMPLNSISITRTAMQATVGGSGLIAATWTARAVDSLGNTLATVGEPQTSYFINVPAQTFTLSKPSGGNAIAGLFVERTSVNTIAGLSAVPLDDFLLSPVPEPGSALTMAAAAAALALPAAIARRRTATRG